MEKSRYEAYVIESDEEAKLIFLNAGILFGYIGFNLLLVFALTYLFRIRDWSRTSKNSNSKAVKDDLPQEAQQTVAQTEANPTDTAAAATIALNPQIATGAREAKNVTSQNT